MNSKLASVPMFPPTVYLIDDEPHLLATLCEVAEMSGLVAVGFERASSFFGQAAGLEQNSILILDLQMPQMDGIEVIRQLAQMAHPPALILISGQDISILHAAEKLAQASHLVVLDTYQKPMVIASLQKLLDQYTPVPTENVQDTGRVTDLNLSAEDLKQAIDTEQLVLHYQPQIELGEGDPANFAAECLVRWQHPEMGLIHPQHFIPLAVSNGLIVDLTNAVLNQMVSQQVQWQQEGLRIKVSINISARDIISLTLPEKISALMLDNRLDPALLTLEVTETELMCELITSLDVLARLRLKGIALSIDDFGTGYSSLTQLYRLPFSELKIDRSFVEKMSTDNEALSIVKACIMLGEQFHMRVVAEGVEDQRTLSLLSDLGCVAAQGYFIGMPMAACYLPHWFTIRALPARQVRH
jgi:EAL domain-containing protein (putative c-di-GMP-specific phosphodiesterase class I)/FixJ family two-component response regulator